IFFHPLFGLGALLVGFGGLMVFGRSTKDRLRLRGELEAAQRERDELRKLFAQKPAELVRQTAWSEQKVKQLSEDLKVERTRREEAERQRDAFARALSECDKELGIYKEESQKYQNEADDWEVRATNAEQKRLEAEAIMRDDKVKREGLSESLISFG